MLCLCGSVSAVAGALRCMGTTKLRIGGLAGAAFTVGQIGLASLVAGPPLHEGDGWLAHDEGRGDEGRETRHIPRERERDRER